VLEVCPTRWSGGASGDRAFPANAPVPGPREGLGAALSAYAVVLTKSPQPKPHEWRRIP
jgi:hypothetical protein